MRKKTQNLPLDQFIIELRRQKEQSLKFIEKAEFETVCKKNTREMQRQWNRWKKNHLNRIKAIDALLLTYPENV